MATLANVRDEMSTAKFPNSSSEDTNLLTAVQRAVEFICDQRGGKWTWLEAETTFTTAAADESYSIASDISVTDLKAIRSLRYENSTTNNEWEVERKSEADFRDKGNLEGINTGEPQEYFEYNGSIYLGPTPDDTYTIRFKYWKNHAIAADTTLLIPSRNAVKEKAFAIYWRDYGDMPELALPHEAEFVKQYYNLISLERRGDEVVAVKYRDL